MHGISRLRGCGTSRCLVFSHSCDLNASFSICKLILLIYLKSLGKVLSANLYAHVHLQKPPHIFHDLQTQFAKNVGLTFATNVKSLIFPIFAASKLLLGISDYLFENQ